MTQYKDPDPTTQLLEGAMRGAFIGSLWGFYEAKAMQWEDRAARGASSAEKAVAKAAAEAAAVGSAAKGGGAEAAATAAKELAEQGQISIARSVRQNALRFSVGIGYLSFMQGFMEDMRKSNDPLNPFIAGFTGGCLLTWTYTRHLPTIFQRYARPAAAPQRPRDGAANRLRRHPPSPLPPSQRSHRRQRLRRRAPPVGGVEGPLGPRSVSRGARRGRAFRGTSRRSVSKKDENPPTHRTGT